MYMHLNSANRQPPILCEEFDPLEKLTHDLDIEDVVGFTVIDKPSAQKTVASGNADLFIESEFCIRTQPSVL